MVTPTSTPMDEPIAVTQITPIDLTAVRTIPA